MATTLKEDVYRVIRDRVLTGPLSPGSRISESALSRELGTSRAPVREAIQQLVTEGLIKQVAQMGTFVSKPNRIELQAKSESY